MAAAGKELEGHWGFALQSQALDRPTGLPVQALIW